MHRCLLRAAQTGLRPLICVVQDREDLQGTASYLHHGPTVVAPCNNKPVIGLYALAPPFAGHSIAEDPFHGAWCNAMTQHVASLSAAPWFYPQHLPALQIPAGGSVGAAVAASKQPGVS